MYITEEVYMRERKRLKQFIEEFKLELEFNHAQEVWDVVWCDDEVRFYLEGRL